MKMTFRWYGGNEPVKIESIAEIPVVSGIASAVRGQQVGEAWKEERISYLKTTANLHGLSFEVVDSLPVHEQIKLGSDKRDLYIANFIKTLETLSLYGVKVVSYNFMPMYEQLHAEITRAADGGLGDDCDDSDTFFQNCGPNIDRVYEDNAPLFDKYRALGSEGLRDNLSYFLDKIVPKAEEFDIKLALHPDDPQRDIFGLPKIMFCAADLDHFLTAQPSQNSGITFCTGAFGADRNNDLMQLLDMARGRVHYAHLRNLLHTINGKYRESAHPTRCGSIDMAAIVARLVDNGFDGYVRPDRGRNIWGETGNPERALYDRALGACYIYGLFESYEKKDGFYKRISLR